MPQKVPVISFNYIDKQLPPDTTKMLKEIYKTYHYRCWCYKQLYNSFKKKDLAVNLSSGILVATGATVGGLVNPIALAVSGLGVLLQVIIRKKKYPKKIEQCQFAYTNYQKELNAFRGYLRGEPFDKSIVLFNLNKLDDMVADKCPFIPDPIKKKYFRKFRVDDQPLVESEGV